MKKVVFVGLVVLLLGALLYVRGHQRERQSFSQITLSPTQTPMLSPTVTAQKETKESVFVPYWSFTNALFVELTSSIIYFGVAANTEGIDTGDVGYKKLAQFDKASSAYKERYLTIRLIDSSVNSKLLEDQKAQEKIIDQSLSLAKAHHFQGIVLDFEIKALAFDSVIKNITAFYDRFAKKTKAENMKFSIALFGDTFYLVRPYDVKTIAKNADEVLVMAYDLHKARGNPGPNFPLAGKERFGYDFTTMTSDFSKQVSLQKLSVVFGLFGYDWVVDLHNDATKLGEPISLAEIKKQFYPTCTKKDCVVKRDVLAKETRISYTDTEGEKHIMWFEDLESMEAKRAFLESKGILSTSLWAYSYY